MGQRIDSPEHRLRELLAQAQSAERTLRQLREGLQDELDLAARQPAQPVFVAPSRRPPAFAPASAGPPAGGPTPQPVSTPAPRPAREPFDWGSLLGARTLAWSGGAIFLLGVFFFLALAIQRGWLSEGARCLLGAAASGALIGTAFELRRRFGALQSALAAAGAGVAGLYGSLLAASSLYHLVSVQVALALALIVGAVAVAVALAFDAESLAVLGLVASLLGPPLLDIRADTATMGALLSACAVAAGLGVGRRWPWLLGLAPVLAWPQAFGWLEDSTVWSGLTLGGAPAGSLEARYPLVAVAVVVAFGAVFYLAGVAWELRDGLAQKLSGLTLGLLSAVGVWWLVVAFKVLADDSLGVSSESWAALAVAVVFLLTPVAAWRRHPGRDLVTLCWGSAVVAVFVVLASALGEHDRAFVAAVAVTAAALAYLARGFREPRLTYAALAHLAVAGGGLLAVAHPQALFDEGQMWEWEWLVAVVVAAACAAMLWAPQSWARRGAPWAAGAVAVYAGSVTIVSLFDPTGVTGDYLMQPVGGDFQLAQTLLSAFWGLVGLACLYAGLRLERRGGHVRYAGFGLLAVAVAKLFLYDLAALDTAARAGSFLALGLVLLVAGFYYQRLTASWEDAPSGGDDPAPPAGGAQSPRFVPPGRG